MVGLVGRDRELAKLHSLVAELAVGRGRSVWVEGEPGIGKTTLVTAGLEGASERGCRVLQAEGDQTASVLPLRLLLDLLQVSPGTDDPERAPVARMLYTAGPAVVAPDQRVTEAAAELLVDLVQRWCSDTPLVLAADDLQWADPLSLAVWGRLQKLTPQLPLLLVSASRPVPQRDQLMFLRERNDVVLAVGPLDEPAVTELASRLAGAAPGPRLAALASQAGGNPFYLEELFATLTRDKRLRVDAGVAELAGDTTTPPASLASAISARLRFLSEPALTTLRLAALLGPSFTVEHLTIVAGQPATALVPIIDEATTAGVLRDAVDALAFRHGLIRQALVDATPTSLRHALHHQAARALAAAGAPAEQVATQLMAGGTGPDGWAVDWARQAAPALVHRAPQVAADLLSRMDHAHLDPSHRDDLAAHKADALMLLGRFGDVVAVARPALDRTADPELAGRFTWILVRALGRLQEYDEALATVDRTLAKRALPLVWAARALAMRAMVLSQAFRFDEVEPAAVAAETAGQQADDPLTVGYSLQARVYLEHVHRKNSTAALALTDRALAVISDLPETSDMRFYLVRNRAATLYRLGRPDEADRWIAEAVTVSDQSGVLTWQADARLAAADNCYQRGQWDDALVHLEAVADLPLKAADVLWPRTLGALIAFHRDDRKALDGYLAGIDESTWTVPERYHGLELLVVRALVAERDHQPARALAGLLAVFDPEASGRFSDLDPTILDWLPELVRLALALGDRRTAEAATTACQDHADRAGGLPQPAAVSQHCRGLCDADAIQVVTVAEAYHRFRLPLHQARALENVAVLYAGNGDLAAARAAYQQAIDLYTQLAAAWDLRRADARLRSFGIRRGTRGPRRRPTTGWDALTPTELKVAHLVAAGHSNPDIATHLYVSRRTVETHISHILTKLGAQSRVDIARHATTRAAG